MLLQIMEEGHLTDSFGRKIDFRNVILIMTTNAGAEVIKSGGGFGFAKKDEDTSYQGMKTRLMPEIEKEFKPEFLGRIDEVVVFRHLTRDNMKDIVEIELSKVRIRLGEKGLRMVLTDEAKEFVIDKGGDLDYGARPLRRSVETYIEDPLSEELLRGSFAGQNLITVKVMEVGDQKRLDFEGSIEQTSSPAETGGELVGAEAAAEPAAAS
jgi:ATP-dependent Clp protease ATP-binding subunit ClpC